MTPHLKGGGPVSGRKAERANDELSLAAKRRAWQKSLPPENQKWQKGCGLYKTELIDFDRLPTWKSHQHVESETARWVPAAQEPDSTPITRPREVKDTIEQSGNTHG